MNHCHYHHYHRNNNDDDNQTWEKVPLSRGGEKGVWEVDEVRHFQVYIRGNQSLLVIFDDHSS